MSKPDINCVTSELVKGLEEWAESSAHSSRFINFYLSLLRIQAEVESKAGIPAIGLPQETLNCRLAEGQPLTRFTEMGIDWDNARETFQKIALLFKEFSDVVPEYSKLKTESLPELNETLAQNWLNGEPLTQETESTGLFSREFATLLHHTLRPFLTGYAIAFKVRFNQQSWRRGNCPACGSIPSFSYLEKENGARYLICSCCNMDWLFQRLDCPFCHNTDHKTLSYKTDETGIYRLYLCEKCKGYLKTIDLRKAGGKINLGLEAITSVDLDLQARELGYGSGEGNRASSSS